MCTSAWFPLLTFPASREWVMSSSCAWFPMLTFPGWTPIQDVSHIQLLCLISIADIPWMNSHPGCESYAAPVLDFHCWHSLDELPSRMWVMCSSCAWFLLLTFPAWTPIQDVSHVQLLCLVSFADIPWMNSHPSLWVMCSSCACFHCWHFLHELPSSLWVMCSSFAWFPLLTFLAWTPIQVVSHVQLLCLILIADIPCMKFHPECAFLWLSTLFPLFDFDC